MSTLPNDTPLVTPESGSIFDLKLKHLHWKDPLHWLALGWKDFVHAPHIGLFYGVFFCLMGHALWRVFGAAPEYVLALSAGFLLLGPFLCLGLYDASRAMEQGRQASLRASLVAWRPTSSTMAIFVGVLLILEMIWGRAAMIVFAVTYTPTYSDQTLLAQLLSWDNLEFLVTYSVVGAIFAGLIFVTSVVAIPMIMDREVDAISASLTSIRACLENSGVMLLWGTILALGTALAMLPWMAGLVVVIPVFGHATWHAYRAVVPTKPTTI